MMRLRKAPLIRLRKATFLSFALLIASLCAGSAYAQEATVSATLQLLAEQRQALTLELEQYEKTLDLLNTDAASPEESANPAVRKLAYEAMLVKQQLVSIASEEVTLLQRQINGTDTLTDKFSKGPGDEILIAGAANGGTLSQRNRAMESKPLRSMDMDYTQSPDAKNVERLHGLLEEYFAQVQHSANVLPTDDEVVLRERAQRDIEMLAKIPYSVDKVRLSGSEGNTALAHITRRLMNPAIPESRRDSAPICSIKTYLFDTLVANESRSLQPVGKNHYVAKVRLQPGESTLSILSERWDVSLQQLTVASDFLITLYRPPGRNAQLHIFAIEDLLALEDAHIPAWLPPELGIQKNQG